MSLHLTKSTWYSEISMVKAELRDGYNCKAELYMLNYLATVIKYLSVRTNRHMTCLY